MKACWFYQKVASWMADSRSEAPRWLKRHRQTCGGCRRFHEEQTLLIATLAATAEAQRSEVPPFLHGRIVSALESNGERVLPFAGRVRWLRAMLIPGVGAALLVVLVFKERRLPPTEPSVPLASWSSLPASLGALVPQADPGQFLAWTEQVDQPLASEMDSVVSDAQTAFHSLAWNFLPDSDQSQPRATREQ